MCFVTYENTPKTATKDIVTYKIVERIYPKRGSLDALVGIRFKAAHYKEQKYALNILYSATGFKQKLTHYAKGHDPKLNPGCSAVYCTEGGFYSYESLDDAVYQFYRYQEWDYTTRFAIIKYVIPKGTQYYESILPAGNNSRKIFCSELIRVIEYRNRKTWKK